MSAIETFKSNLASNILQEALRGGSGTEALDACRNELTGYGFSKQEATQLTRKLLVLIRRDQVAA